LHTACGTPAYTAPEILRRSGGYDGSKADAWSCGLILYVLLAGYLPFSDLNIPAMCKKISRRDYQFPDWISKRARFVIYRLLDPNPESRMSLEGLFTNEWFKKSLKPESEPKKNVFGFDYGNEVKISGLNAFHIISMSSGLDLSGLFETTSSQGGNNSNSVNKREKRFTSSAKMEVMEEKVKEVGGVFGFKVEIGKNNAIGLVKGKVGLVIEVFEIVPSQLLLVDVKVVEGGLEFEDNHWEDWKVALQDLAISWHNEESS
ncbi:CBL-interacting serine/threonine-protein kinase 7-like, partial [Trifolium medium]|nr:CBL-interacting serine/threonine-protein kinase 7-like [Trifolium medium]